MIKLNIRKNLQTQEGNIILDIELNFKKGSFTALYGKSGVGKTTILKMLAGLVKPNQGFIVKEGEIWNDTSRNIFVKAQDRNVGFVFQDYALFPNMTVRENIEFACSGKTNNSFIYQLLEITSLNNMADKYPAILSGGQKQRVALARALARKPQLLLLDEPFSALDSETKLNLYSELKNIHESFGLTTILVSHCLEEVKILCEKVVVIESGKILKQGKYNEVFNDIMYIELTGIIIEINQEEYPCTIIASTEMEYLKMEVQEIHQLKKGDKIIIRKAASIL